MKPSEKSHLQSVALTHEGMKGKNNEDRCGVFAYILGENDPTPALFAVLCDGIGGHRAGEVASEMAVDLINKRVAISTATNPLHSMQEAIQTASQKIFEQSQSDSGKQGMGATCACAWIIGKQLYTATVGDSRIYLMRDGRIQQVSTDHTWIQEALENGLITPDQIKGHPNAHVIRRYLGSANPPEVDFRLKLSGNETNEQAIENQGTLLKNGDHLLICSDGLSDLVEPGEILAAFNDEKSMNAVVQGLINLANQRGGHDNITVIAIQVPDKKPAPPKKGFSSLLGIGCLLAFLFGLLVLGGGAFFYRSQIIGFFRPSLTPTLTATLSPSLTPSPSDTVTIIPSLTPSETSTETPTSNPANVILPPNANMTPIAASGSNATPPQEKKDTLDLNLDAFSGALSAISVAAGETQTFLVGDDKGIVYRLNDFGEVIAQTELDKNSPVVDLEQSPNGTIWALLNSNGDEFGDSLYTLNRELEKKQSQDTAGSVGKRFGVSNKKIWFGRSLYDDATGMIGQKTLTALSASTSYAYAYDDIHQEMWMGSSDGIVIFDAVEIKPIAEDNLPQDKVASRSMAFDGSRIWLVDIDNFLLAYDTNKPFTPTTSPDFSVSLNQYFLSLPPLELFAAGDSVWMLGNQSNTWKLFSINPQNPQEYREFEVGKSIPGADSESQNAAIDMATDGQNTIWVLTEKTIKIFTISE